MIKIIKVADSQGNNKKVKAKLYQESQKFAVVKLIALNYYSVTHKATGVRLIDRQYLNGARYAMKWLEEQQEFDFNQPLSVMIEQAKSTAGREFYIKLRSLPDFAST